MAETYAGEFYCVKCKEKRQAEGDVVVSESGRKMAKAICPVCGTKLNRILGKACPSRPDRRAPSPAGDGALRRPRAPRRSRRRGPPPRGRPSAPVDGPRSGAGPAWHSGRPTTDEEGP